MACFPPEVTIRDLGASELTIRVRLSRPLRFRIWLGVKIMALGALVTGFHPEVICEDGPEDYTGC
ncbi:MAG: hypothetical protein K2P78_02420 [Gemmataceae bacterium]|nr:hypothetical protein [Gemmataceae bacterium]